MALAGAWSLAGHQHTDHPARCLRAITGTEPRGQCRTFGLTVVLDRRDGAIVMDWRGGRYLAAFDGRLDNGAELARALDMADGDAPPRRTAPGEDAAALLVRAYGRWGDDVADHLTGEFVFVLWDEHRRRLILGRDALGTRPLHFWTGSGVVLFASEARGLLAHPDVPRAADPDWLGHWLTLRPAADTATFHAGIKRVPPGHVMVIQADGVRTHRYWRPENLAPIRLARDADYAHALRDLLDQAVGCRLPAGGDVGISLSGGLDSTSIAVLAARRLADQGRRLTAFTAIPAGTVDAAALIANEGADAALAVAGHANVDHILIHNDALPLFQAMDLAHHGADQPILNPFNVMWGEAILRAAKDRRLAVLLNGAMGNATISYDGRNQLNRQFRAGQWRWLARHGRALWRGGHPLHSLLYRTLAPSLPPWLDRLCHRATGRHPPPAWRDFSAINPALCHRLGLDRDFVGTVPAGQDPRLFALTRFDPARAFGRQRRNGGVESADPTLDRRIVEFCLAIPPEQFLLHGQPRSLIRRAMAGLLPDSLLAPRRRGQQAADWPQAFTAARPDMLAELDRLDHSPLARDCLDLARLRRLLEQWPRPDLPAAAQIDRYACLVARGIAVGRFIRRFEGGNQ